MNAAHTATSFSVTIQSLVERIRGAWCGETEAKDALDDLDTLLVTCRQLRSSVIETNTITNHSEFLNCLSIVFHSENGIVTSLYKLYNLNRSDLCQRLLEIIHLLYVCHISDIFNNNSHQSSKVNIIDNTLRYSVDILRYTTHCLQSKSSAVILNYSLKLINRILPLGIDRKDLIVDQLDIIQRLKDKILDIAISSVDTKYPQSSKGKASKTLFLLLNHYPDLFNPVDIQSYYQSFLKSAHEQYVTCRTRNMAIESLSSENLTEKPTLFCGRITAISYMMKHVSNDFGAGGGARVGEISLSNMFDLLLFCITHSSGITKYSIIKAGFKWLISKHDLFEDYLYSNAIVVVRNIMKWCRKFNSFNSTMSGSSSSDNMLPSLSDPKTSLYHSKQSHASKMALLLEQALELTLKSIGRHTIHTIGNRLDVDNKNLVRSLVEEVYDINGTCQSMLSMTSISLLIPAIIIVTCSNSIVYHQDFITYYPVGNTDIISQWLNNFLKYGIRKINDITLSTSPSELLINFIRLFCILKNVILHVGTIDDVAVANAIVIIENGVEFLNIIQSSSKKQELVKNIILLFESLSTTTEKIEILRQKIISIIFILIRNCVRDKEYGLVIYGPLFIELFSCRTYLPCDNMNSILPIVSIGNMLTHEFFSMVSLSLSAVSSIVDDDFYHVDTNEVNNGDSRDVNSKIDEQTLQANLQLLYYYFLTGSKPLLASARSWMKTLITKLLQLLSRFPTYSFLYRVFSKVIEVYFSYESNGLNNSDHEIYNELHLFTSTIFSNITTINNNEILKLLMDILLCIDSKFIALHNFVKMLKLGLRVGLIHYSIAERCIKKLKANTEILKNKEYMLEVLPLLNAFFTINDVIINDRHGTKKFKKMTYVSNTTKEKDSMMTYFQNNNKGGATSDTRANDMSLEQLQAAIIEFYGSLGEGTALSLLYSDTNNVDSKHSNGWDCNGTTIQLPFDLIDIKSESKMIFDNCIPRLLQLCMLSTSSLPTSSSIIDTSKTGIPLSTSSSLLSKTKEQACELLHFLVRYMIGMNATTRESVRSTRRGAAALPDDDTNTQSQNKAFLLPFKLIFPVLIKLSCDNDVTLAHLFQSLVLQMARWFAKSEIDRPDTISMVETIFDCLILNIDNTNSSNSNNSTDGNNSNNSSNNDGTDSVGVRMRDFAAKVLSEYVYYLLKHWKLTSSGNNDIHPMIFSILKKLYSCCNHPSINERMGGLCALNVLLDCFQESEMLIDIYVLEVLHHVLVSMRSIQNDILAPINNNDCATTTTNSSTFADQSRTSQLMEGTSADTHQVSTNVIGQTIVSKLIQLIKRKSSILKLPSKNRQLYSNIQEFLLYNIKNNVVSSCAFARRLSMRVHNVLIVIVPDFASNSGLYNCNIPMLSQFDLESISTVPSYITSLNINDPNALYECSQWFQRLTATFDFLFWVIQSCHADVCPISTSPSLHFFLSFSQVCKTLSLSALVCRHSVNISRQKASRALLALLSLIPGNSYVEMKVFGGDILNNETFLENFILNSIFSMQSFLGQIINIHNQQETDSTSRNLLSILKLVRNNALQNIIDTHLRKNEYQLKQLLIEATPLSNNDANISLDQLLHGYHLVYTAKLYHKDAPCKVTISSNLKLILDELNMSINNEFSANTSDIDMDTNTKITTLNLPPESVIYIIRCLRLMMKFEIPKIDKEILSFLPRTTSKTNVTNGSILDSLYYEAAVVSITYDPQKAIEYILNQINTTHSERFKLVLLQLLQRPQTSEKFLHALISLWPAIDTNNPLATYYLSVIKALCSRIRNLCLASSTSNTSHTFFRNFLGQSNVSAVIKTLLIFLKFNSSDTGTYSLTQLSDVAICIPYFLDCDNIFNSPSEINHLSSSNYGSGETSKHLLEAVVEIVSNIPRNKLSNNKEFSSTIQVASTSLYEAIAISDSLQLIHECLPLLTPVSSIERLLAPTSQLMWDFELVLSSIDRFLNNILNFYKDDNHHYNFLLHYYNIVMESTDLNIDQRWFYYNNIIHPFLYLISKLTVEKFFKHIIVSIIVLVMTEEERALKKSLNEKNPNNNFRSICLICNRNEQNVLLLKLCVSLSLLNCLLEILPYKSNVFSTSNGNAMDVESSPAIATHVFPELCPAVFETADSGKIIGSVLSSLFLRLLQPSNEHSLDTPWKQYYFILLFKTVYKIITLTQQKKNQINQLQKTYLLPKNDDTNIVWQHLVRDIELTRRNCCVDVKDVAAPLSNDYIYIKHQNSVIDDIIIEFMKYVAYFSEASDNGIDNSGNESSHNFSEDFLRFFSLLKCRYSLPLREYMLKIILRNIELFQPLSLLVERYPLFVDDVLEVIIDSIKSSFNVISFEMFLYLRVLCVNWKVKLTSNSYSKCETLIDYIVCENMSVKSDVNIKLLLESILSLMFINGDNDNSILATRFNNKNYINYFNFSKADLKDDLTPLYVISLLLEHDIPVLNPNAIVASENVLNILRECGKIGGKASDQAVRVLTLSVKLEFKRQGCNTPMFLTGVKLIESILKFYESSNYSKSNYSSYIQLSKVIVCNFPLLFYKLICMQTYILSSIAPKVFGELLQESLGILETAVVYYVNNINIVNMVAPNTVINSIYNYKLFKKIIESRDVIAQLFFLKIIILFYKLKLDKFDLIKDIIDNFGHSEDSECRMEFYRLLMLINDDYNLSYTQDLQTSRESMSTMFKNDIQLALLKGLNDPNTTNKDEVFKYFNNNIRLSQSCFMRLQQCLTEMFSTGIETVYTSTIAKFLLSLVSLNQKRYSSNIFSHPLDECEFKPLTMAVQRHEFGAISTAFYRGGLGDSSFNDSSFRGDFVSAEQEPVLINASLGVGGHSGSVFNHNPITASYFVSSNLSTSNVSSYGSMMGGTFQGDDMMMGGTFQGGISHSLSSLTPSFTQFSQSRRIENRISNNLRRGTQYQESHHRLFHLNRRQKDRYRQICYNRQFRDGEVCDIENISSKSFNTVLLSLCELDESFASEVVYSIFNVIYNADPCDDSILIKQQSLSNVKAEIPSLLLKTNSNNIRNTFLKICYYNKISLDYNVINWLVAGDADIHVCLYILEQQIRDSSTVVVPSTNHNKEWGEILKIYNLVGASEFVTTTVRMQYFQTMQANNGSTAMNEKKKKDQTISAVEHEMSHRYLDAAVLYQKLINECDTDFSHLMQLSELEKGRNQALSMILRWDDLYDCVHDINDDADDANDDISKSPDHIAWFVSSGIKRKHYDNVFKFLNKSVTSLPAILPSYAFEYAVLLLQVENNYHGCQYYYQIAVKNIIKQVSINFTSKSNINDNNRNKMSLLLFQSQRLVELNECLSILQKRVNDTSDMNASTSENEILTLLSMWQSRLPGDMIMEERRVDDILFYRLLYIDLLKNCNYFNSLSASSRTETSKSIITTKGLLLLNSASCYRQKGNVEALNSLVNLVKSMEKSDPDIVHCCVQKLLNFHVCLLEVNNLMTNRKEMNKLVECNAANKIDSKLISLQEALLTERDNNNNVLIRPEHLLDVTLVRADWKERLLTYYSSGAEGTLQDRYEGISRVYELYNDALKSVENSSKNEHRNISSSRIRLSLFASRYITDEAVVKASANSSITSSCLASCCVEGILLALPYIEAISLFPLVLQLIVKYNSAQKSFKTYVDSIDVSSILCWIPQILSTISKFESKADCLFILLNNIATRFPQMLYHAFHFSYNHSFSSEVRSKAEFLLSILSNDLLLKFSKSLLSLWNVAVKCQRLLENIKFLIVGNKFNEASLAFTEISRLFSVQDIDTDWLYHRSFAFELKRGFSACFSEFYCNGSYSIDSNNSKAFFKRMDEFNKSLNQWKLNNGGKDLTHYNTWLAEYRCSETHSENSFSNKTVIEIPSRISYASLRYNPYNINYVAQFDLSIRHFDSKQAPIKMNFILNNGQTKSYIIKCGEDLRLDERIQSLFSLFNFLLYNNSNYNTSNKNMCYNSISTYTVLPLSTDHGLLEFVNHTSTLSDIINTSCLKLNSNSKLSRPNKELDMMWYDGEMRKGLPDCSNKETALRDYPHENHEALVTQYQSIISNIKNGYLRQALINLSSSSENYLEIRSNFGNSLGVLNISSYILGIGDRHFDNFLINKNSGLLTSIDFGCSFDSAIEILHYPELAPLRLTPQLINSLSPLDTLLCQKMLMSAVCGVYRDPNSYIIIDAALQIFTHEPIADWTRRATYVKENLRLTDNTTNDCGDGQSSTIDYEQSKINNVLYKLKGYNPSIVMIEELERNKLPIAVKRNLQEVIHGSTSSFRYALKNKEILTIDEQISCLIDASTDGNVLARFWKGWRPHL